VLREREELARELHDTVAHHVSAIAIRAQAGKTLAASNPDAPLEALEVIEAEASKTLAEMRSIVAVLRQGAEPDLAPQPGVRDIDELARDAVDGPAVAVEGTGDLGDVAPSVGSALYRIAQESITNAVRHSRNATQVTVTVTDLGDEAQMTVHDDGDMTLHTPRPQDGFGLTGMRERAKLLGGWCTAGPAPDGGWTVTAVLPKNGGLR
jgi:signal transduction histidine kinase